MFTRSGSYSSTDWRAITCHQSETTMKLKFLAGESPIYSHSALHQIINSIRETYMRTPGRLGLTRIRTDMSQDKWIPRTRQRGMNPADQFPRMRCPRWPHLTWSVREEAPFGLVDEDQSDDSRGNVPMEFYRAVRTHGPRVARTFERTN